MMETDQNSKPIYPDVKIRRKEKCISFETYLRKKHRGKYYFIHHFLKFIDEADSKIDFLDHFHKEVYKSLILQDINLNYRYDYNGLPVYELDKDQRSEKIRLKNL